MATFRDFEHGRWQEAVETYAGCWAGLTRQTVPPLLAALQVIPEDSPSGRELRNRACRGGGGLGRGFGRGSRLLQPNAVQSPDACTPHSTSGWGTPRIWTSRTGASTPWPSISGCSISNIRSGLWPRRYRVLRPGGRAAYTVWAPPDQSRAFEVVYGSIREYGTLEVPLPPGPPFFRFGDPEESRRTPPGNRVPGTANRVDSA